MEEDKLAMPEFKALWTRINAKSVYVVDFDTNELIKKSIAALNSKLHVSKVYFQVVSGTMNQIKSKDDLISGASFVREESNQYLPAFLNQILRNIIWKPWKNYCPTRIHTLQNVRSVSKMKMY